MPAGMRIVDILSEDLVVPELKASGRNAALETLVAQIAKAEDVDPSRVLQVLIEREEAGSTGVGTGIAIPHAKLPGLKKPVACFARSREGVNFGCLDGKPAHIFLAIVVPEGQTGIHLKALARASRLLKSNIFREEVMAAAPQDLWTVISTHDRQLT